MKGFSFYVAKYYGPEWEIIPYMPGETDEDGNRLKIDNKTVFGGFGSAKAFLDDCLATDIDRYRAEKRRLKAYIHNQVWQEWSDNWRSKAGLPLIDVTEMDPNAY